MRPNFPELRARDQDGVAMVLATVTHPSLTTALRLSADPTTIIEDHHPEFGRTYGTISRGETYQFVPFTYAIEAGDPETPPTASLRLQNTDYRILETLEQIDLGGAPASIALEIVHSSNLDLVREAHPNFIMAGWTHDDEWIDVGLAFDARTRGSFPYHRYTRSATPGLHRT